MITFNAMKDIKWGIVGPGKIAVKFAEDLNLVNNAIIHAVASRDKQRAQDFAKKFNIQHSYGSYDALFGSDVDVIYVATPHVFHKDLTIQAMKNGKHVLCEKPLGVNMAEVSEMLETARDNKVFLMEALWSRFNPSIASVKTKIEEGLIGEVKYINADFAFYAMDRGVDSRLLNPNLAGGSLLDIGIYPVFLAYLILGMPNNITASANILDNGLEIQVGATMTYDNAQAMVYSGLNHNSRMSAEIAGEKGSIYINPRWHEADGYTQNIDGVHKKIDLPKQGNGYTYEIEEVHKCLKQGTLVSELWSHNDSKNLISLLDEIRGVTGIRFPFEKD
jgi:predicted dehydrogenase